MRTDRSNSKWARAKRTVTGGDRGRAVVAAAGVVGLLLAVFFIGAGMFSASSPPPASGTRSGATAASGPHQPEQHLGSVLFAPSIGDRCEERGFDYRRGQIVSDRYVKCDAGLVVDPAPAHGKIRDNTVRIRAILDDFKKRK